jgi:hypothetical protein
MGGAGINRGWGWKTQGVRLEYTGVGLGAVLKYVLTLRGGHTPELTI